MLELSAEASIDLKRYKRTLPTRVSHIASVIGQGLSDFIADEVKKRLPSGGGWLDLYRDSMQFMSIGPMKWAILAQAEVELTTIPADRSLLFFVDWTSAAAGSYSTVMRQFNPWTIDAIPAVANGYQGKFVVKAASEGEVSVRRAALSDQMEEVVTRLNAQGARVEEFGVTKINGTIIADLAFLSRRLEYGLGGFPRSPHWNPVVMQVRDKKGSQGLTKSALKDIEEIMKEGT